MKEERQPIEYGYGRCSTLYQDYEYEKHIPFRSALGHSCGYCRMGLSCIPQHYRSCIVLIRSFNRGKLYTEAIYRHGRLCAVALRGWALAPDARHRRVAFHSFCQHHRLPACVAAHPPVTDRTGRERKENSGIAPCHRAVARRPACHRLRLHNDNRGDIRS